jgi:hypothetical protein
VCGSNFNETDVMTEKQGTKSVIQFSLKICTKSFEETWLKFELFFNRLKKDFVQF